MPSAPMLRCLCHREGYTIRPPPRHGKPVIVRSIKTLTLGVLGKGTHVNCKVEYLRESVEKIPWSLSYDIAGGGEAFGHVHHSIPFTPMISSAILGMVVSCPRYSF